MPVIREIVSMNGVLWAGDFGDQINLDAEDLEMDAGEIPNYKQINSITGWLSLNRIPFTSPFKTSNPSAEHRYRLPKRKVDDLTNQERNYYEKMKGALMNGLPKSKVGVGAQVVSEDEYQRRIEELLPLIIGYNARELAFYYPRKKD